MVCDIPDSDLELIPSNNLTYERNLSKFDSVARRSSKCSNKNFKAKSIRDDMTIYKRVDVGKIKTSLQRLLDARESKWHQEQKKLEACHIEEKTT